MTSAHHRALCLEAPAGVDVGVGIGELGVVGAGELDLPLGCGQLLAARAGVLQGSHFGRVSERRERGGREEKEKREVRKKERKIQSYKVES